MVKRLTSTANVDRRNVFVVRSALDKSRFPDYPEDALAYRGGYEQCGNRIGAIKDSFGLEVLYSREPEVGTWIIDEAAFFDERLAYLTKDEAESESAVLSSLPCC